MNQTHADAECRDEVDKIADGWPKPPENTRRFEVYMEFCRWAAKRPPDERIQHGWNYYSRATLPRYFYSRDMPGIFETGTLPEDECRVLMAKFEKGKTS